VVACSFATAVLGACSESAGDDHTSAEGVGAGDTATVALAASGCLTPTAGAGFLTQSISPVSRFAVLDFTATASSTDLDGVIGVTSGAATGFDRLAIAVRFAPRRRDRRSQRRRIPGRQRRPVRHRPRIPDPRGRRSDVAHLLGLRADQ
jgi:hypothetical protein